MQHYQTRNGDSWLDDFVRCLGRVFVTRRYYLHRLGGDCYVGALACKATDDRAYSAELFVIRDFLRDIPRLSRCMKSGLSIVDFGLHFAPVWFKAHELVATSRNYNAETDCICLNDALMRITFDGMAYFLHDHQIKNPEEVARLCVEKYESFIRLAKNVRRAGLDDVEVAAFFQLLIAYYEKELFVSEELHQEYVNSAFRELSHHYKSTYNEYAERLGVLMALLGEFHAMIMAVGEALVIVNLYSLDCPTCEGASGLKDYRAIHKFRSTFSLI